MPTEPVQPFFQQLPYCDGLMDRPVDGQTDGQADGLSL